MNINTSMNNTHSRLNTLIPVLFTLGLSLMIASNSYALESDRQQPINVEADRAEFRELEGLTVYSGNVRISQGSILLVANEVSIHSAEGSVSHLIAVGERAYFEQRPEEGEDKIVAQSEKIEYLLANDVIKLSRNASLTQQGATLNGNLITYDVRNHLLVADSATRNSGNANDTTASGRVRVTIPSLESAPSVNRDIN